MPDFTITIPTDKVAVAKAALCSYIGKTDPADQTLANAKAGHVQLLKNTIKQYEAQQTHNAAATAAAAIADVDVT